MTVAVCNMLLTGATGFVGGALVKRLAGEYPARFVLAAVRGLDLALPENVRPVLVGDSLLANDWRTVLQGVEVVVHCAARVHVMQDEVGDPLEVYRKVNVKGTLNLARQSAETGVNRFVFISSVKVNGEYTLQMQAFNETDASNPQDAYSQSKHEAEVGLRQISTETGMEVVIIRPPLVYGPGVKANFAALMRAVHKGWPLPLGAVHNQRSLVALDNLVDFIITCINHPNAANQTFLVSDGQDLSTTELLQGMAKAAGVPSRLLPIPVWALQTAASVLGKGDVIQRLCGNLQVDISKARNLLGWTPPISVEEGLRRAMQSAP